MRSAICPRQQAKLLRVLQNQEVQRVDSPRRARWTRVVAATNDELRADIAGKRFQEDLYYRLSMQNCRRRGLRRA